MVTIKLKLESLIVKMALQSESSVVAVLCVLMRYALHKDCWRVGLFGHFIDVLLHISHLLLVPLIPEVILVIDY